jgi:hypothetical protein
MRRQEWSTYRLIRGEADGASRGEQGYRLRAVSDEIPTVPLAVVAPCDEQPVPIF